MRRPSASSADGAKWKPRADGSARNFQAALRSIAAACGDAVGASLSVASANARQPRSSTDARASSPHNVSACNATLRPWSPKRGANDATRDVNRRHPFSFVFVFLFTKRFVSFALVFVPRRERLEALDGESRLFELGARVQDVRQTLLGELLHRPRLGIVPLLRTRRDGDERVERALRRRRRGGREFVARQRVEREHGGERGEIGFFTFLFCIELCVTSASLKETHPVCETLDATNASSLEMPLYAFASSCAFIADAVRAALRATLFTASSKTSAKFLETSSPSRRTPFLCRLTFIHQSRASSCPSACSTFAHTRAVVFGASVFRRTRRSATTARAKATFSDSSSLSYSRSEDSWSPPTRSAAPREEQSLLLLASTTNSAATLTSLTPFGND
jgi:hypothetical protein